MDSKTRSSVKAKISLLASEIVDAGFAFGEDDEARAAYIMRVVAAKALELDEILMPAKGD